MTGEFWLASGRQQEDQYFPHKLELVRQCEPIENIGKDYSHYSFYTKIVYTNPPPPRWIFLPLYSFLLTLKSNMPFEGTEFRSLILLAVS